jgi:hypothetical protein
MSDSLGIMSYIQSRNWRGRIKKRKGCRISGGVWLWRDECVFERKRIETGMPPQMEIDIASQAVGIAW